jgi:aspartyl-tRNA(Asn)/glutamyl-tRNA(Gln) amidotransferase subunit C
MAKPEINKDTLEYLARLARIKLDPSQEPKLLSDLQKILEYVSELQSVDTSKVAPMNGGTALTNVFREDGAPENTHRGAGVEQFPEDKNGFLKVPPVFGGGAASANGAAGASGPAGSSEP